MKSIKHSFFLRIILLALAIQHTSFIDASNIFSSVRSNFYLFEDGNGTISNYTRNLEEPINDHNKSDKDNSLDFTCEDNIEIEYLYIISTMNDFFAFKLLKISFSYKDKYSEQFHPDIVPPPPKA
jgi:hypothetical protein